MARVTFINSILSGKLAGMVFANNKAGEYVRQYRKGTDPATVAQLANRASFTAASTSWHAMTDIQKAAWNSFAVTDFKPKVGNSGVRFSGFNAFVSLNNVILNLIPKASIATVLVPAAVTATYVSFGVSPIAPIHPLSSMIHDSYDHPLSLILTEVTLTAATGACTFSFDLLGAGGIGPQSAAPKFEDSIGATAVGIAIVASLPIVQNQMFVANPDLNLVAVMFPPLLSGWTSSRSIQFSTDPIPGYLDRKLGYEAEQLVQFKAYLVGKNGMTQPLNAIKQMTA